MLNRCVTLSVYSLKISHVSTTNKCYICANREEEDALKGISTEANVPQCALLTPKTSFYARSQSLVGHRTRWDRVTHTSKGNEQTQKKAMSEVDNSNRDEGETAKPTLEPPQPDISATTAIREDQVQNAVAFLSHPKVADKYLPGSDKRLIACWQKPNCLFRYVVPLRIRRSLSCKRRV